ncbi:Uncharacterised protein [Legionella steigerwaltii]|uniref:Dot/Icm secretion system substrate n=1 Tax=Legionella steigerwaltii TaxID=460 RepID=A0A378LCQ1_9GAMM|nr:hypothetical protein [Legionella steigerwaltii]KTD78502.1 hypothetical protein Lstg_1237 [Legionella steigerwaltii]STY24140.1 Uncharacterised protein [Legionella steigerwaltii]
MSMSKEEREKKKQQELEIEEQNRKKTTIKPTNINKDWSKIVDDYKKQYGREPDEKNGALVFDSPEEVTKFFMAQATAKPPREFHCVYLGEDGKPMDKHVFSCGSGHLFQGSLKEIQDQIKNALKDDPENQNLKNGKAYIKSLINPTKDMRQSLSDMQSTSDETHSESHRNSMGSF